MTEEGTLSRHERTRPCPSGLATAYRPTLSSPGLTTRPIWKTTDEVFKGKKVVLFAVPGAFTPTCNNNHLPGFLKNVDAFKGKGIDTVTVTGINDVFVLQRLEEVDRPQRQDRISGRREWRFSPKHST